MEEKSYEDSEDNLSKIRHSCAHILAYAVKQLFPKAQLGIGPSIEDGFYYDFAGIEFTVNDLGMIEAKMQEIINKNLEFKKEDVTKKDAEKLLKKLNERFKLEILNDIKDKDVSLYHTGDFVDLCKGPHVKITKEIGAFKLLRIAGAYWKGDSKNEMLQRIYGTAFPTKNELKEYLRLREEAEKRNHVNLGKELDLFSFHEEGPGFPFWHPKGTIIYNSLVEFIREENAKRGYNEIRTPLILNEILWKKSGHWDNFRNNMYFTKIDEKEFAVKPMNCPGGVLIYKSRLHSYRELPIRNAEFGMVHRHELSGVLNGLFRVRSFVQDDAHIFCTIEQIEEEISNLIDFTLEVYNVFGFAPSVFIATKPEKYIGSDKNWEVATSSLINALKNKSVPFGIKEGEGAFYGPKIEFNIQDSLKRNWQCGTIQVDFSMPERFEVTYEGNDGKKHTPVMIHRAILGAVERFIGILIEHYAGKLPLWLNPVQVRIMTVADRNLKFAEHVLMELRENNIRTELDDRSESIPKKVRDAQLSKANFMLTVGDKEEQNKTLAIRTREGKVEFNVKVSDFVNEIVQGIRNRSN